MRTLRDALPRKPRRCRFCGNDYTPADVTGPAPILVDCKRCNGRGGSCRACPPKPAPGLPTGRDLHFRPSGNGCGKIHADGCQCFRCVDRELPSPADVQTCGQAECVAAWRLGLGSGKPPAGPTPEELRIERLRRACVPGEFWKPFEREKMNHGMPCEIIARRRIDGKPKAIDGDIMEHAIFSEHPHVYIWGPLQIGKTRFAVNILDRALSGREVADAIWTTPGILADKLAGQKLGEPSKLEKRCKEARLCIIDDIFTVGEGFRSREAREAVERILYERWDSAMPTIVTSSARPSPKRRAEKSGEKEREQGDNEKTLSERIPQYYERLQQGIQVAVGPAL